MINTNVKVKFGEESLITQQLMLKVSKKYVVYLTVVWLIVILFWLRLGWIGKNMTERKMLL